MTRKSAINLFADSIFTCEHCHISSCWFRYSLFVSFFIVPLLFFFVLEVLSTTGFSHSYERTSYTQGLTFVNSFHWTSVTIVSDTCPPSSLTPSPSKLLPFLIRLHDTIIVWHFLMFFPVTRFVLFHGSTQVVFVLASFSDFESDMCVLNIRSLIIFFFWQQMDQDPMIWSREFSWVRVTCERHAKRRAVLSSSWFGNLQASYRSAFILMKSRKESKERWSDERDWYLILWKVRWRGTLLRWRSTDLLISDILKGEAKESELTLFLCAKTSELTWRETWSFFLLGDAEASIFNWTVTLNWTHQVPFVFQWSSAGRITLIMRRMFRSQNIARSTNHDDGSELVIRWVARWKLVVSRSRRRTLTWAESRDQDRCETAEGQVRRSSERAQSSSTYDKYWHRWSKNSTICHYNRNNSFWPAGDPKSWKRRRPKQQKGNQQAWPALQHSSEQKADEGHIIDNNVFEQPLKYIGKQVAILAQEPFWLKPFLFKRCVALAHLPKVTVFVVSFLRPRQTDYHGPQGVECDGAPVRRMGDFWQRRFRRRWSPRIIVDEGDTRKKGVRRSFEVKQ